eukprot:COSAG05_NODE_926_length_6575_cov_6.025324_3_plen_177_part_00
MLRGALCATLSLARRFRACHAPEARALQGVIDGFPEMSTKVGLQDIISKPQLRGLWTWTRGGGWWGPYIHGNEQWVDLHARVLAKWWTSHQPAIVTSSGASAIGAASPPPLSEAQAFAAVCPGLLPGCSSENGCCASFRNFSLSTCCRCAPRASIRLSLSSHWNPVHSRGALAGTK